MFPTRKVIYRANVCASAKTSFNLDLIRLFCHLIGRSCCPTISGWRSPLEFKINLYWFQQSLARQSESASTDQMCPSWVSKSGCRPLNHRQPFLLVHYTLRRSALSYGKNWVTQSFRIVIGGIIFQCVSQRNVWENVATEVVVNHRKTKLTAALC